MNPEDLTKDELIKLIHEMHYFLPSPRDILKVHWESVNEKARVIMDEAIEESQRWTGKSDPLSIKNWMAAQDRFNEGLALSEKADKVLGELMALNKDK